jgi:predicted TPR repeat methyltransferase
MDNREATLRAAVERDPASAAAHSGLAAHYYAAGELNDSVREYRLALVLAPDVPQAHYNLAATLDACGETHQALAVIDKAERAFPDSALVHYGKACVLQNLCRLDDSLASFAMVLQLDPTHVDAWYGVGVVLLRQGNALRASHFFERAVDVDPQHTAARYMCEALSGRTRTRPAETFVRQLFDSYAASYDEHMVGQLGYRAPELLRGTVNTALPGATGLRVLDLGCGTGLLGARLRPLAARLVGVDLAPGMLERAAALGCYDQLECGDVLEYLDRQAAGSQDLVVAADLFIYFAELEEAFAAIRRVLRPAGLVAFSVEEQTGKGWSVGPSGRFRHSRTYLETLRDASGYTAVSFERAVLRNDGGEPVEGLIVAWSA